jgi:anti-sigma factor RsiW
MSQNMHHPKPARLEALVDGTLPETEGATVASHVQTCGRCAAEVEELRQLFAALADLPRVAPSAGFADRVMAGVRVAEAPATVPARPPLADRLRALVPGRRLGWSLAAAFTGVPAVATAAALVWLASQPTLSAQALWIFATQRIAAAASAATGWLVESLAATRLAGWLGAFGRGLVAVEPGQLGIAAAAMLALSGLSAWVLYRNLIRTPTRERHHVSYSF